MTSTPGLADVAEARRAAYGLLASLFLYPDGKAVERALALADELRRESELIRPFPFFRSMRSILDRLGREAGTGLEEEYADLFLLGGSRPPCPLYESAYVDPIGFDRGLVAAEVEQAYAAAGVALAPSAAGELPDHVALELEFVSLLCAGEAEAWSARLPERAAEILNGERTFLDGHLGRWFPALARRVSSVSAESNFYRQLAEATRAFLVHDRDLIGVLSEAHAPSPRGVVSRR